MKQKEDSMNQLTIIGSLGADPVTRATKEGIQVTSFNVAVSNRDKTTTWFRCSAWRGLSDVCSKYLKKGSKIAVTGSVTLNTYKGNDGQNKANLEVNCDTVEFLSSKDEQKTPDERAGFVKVDDSEDLPF